MDLIVSEGLEVSQPALAQSQEWKNQNNVWNLLIVTLDTCQWRRSDVFIINFEQISDFAVVFPLLTLNK